MSNETAVKDNFYKRKKRVLAMMSTSTVFQQYVEYLEDLLARERQEYEDTEASEFARGRVWLLKSLISELKQGK